MTYFLSSLPSSKTEQASWWRGSAHTFHTHRRPPKASLLFHYMPSPEHIDKQNGHRASGALFCKQPLLLTRPLQFPRSFFCCLRICRSCVVKGRTTFLFEQNDASFVNESCSTLWMKYGRMITVGKSQLLTGNDCSTVWDYVSCTLREPSGLNWCWQFLCALLAIWVCKSFFLWERLSQ